MSRNAARTRLVYSTEQGPTCPTCTKPLRSCRCAAKTSGSPPPGDGVVRVERQTKGRKGKGVTIVRGIPLGEAELKALGAKLKKKCGSGGTIKNGVIEIQGDHRDLLIPELQSHGWTVKRAGG